MAAAYGLRAAAVEVEITGLTPELARNVRAFLSIAELADAGSRAADDSTADPASPEGGSDAGRASDADRPSDAEGADADRGETERDADADRDNDDLEDDEDLSELRVRRLHAAAEAEIEAALQPFGYYSPTVDAQLERDDEDWIARYAIDPGPPTLISYVNIQVLGEGGSVAAVQAARGAITLAPGDVLNHQRYAAAKQSLYDAVYKAGFIDAAYTRSELRVHRAAREAEIDLVLDSGPRYYFGNVTIEQDILSEDFIDRFVSIERGEPFDTDRLVALQIALSDSGYFNEVTIDVERDRTEERRIPVVVHAAPRRTQEFTVGIGYGTDTGPRLSLGVELRRLNMRGHRFTADLRLSSIEQAVATEYRIPRGRNVSTDFLALRGSLGNQEIADWDTRQLSAGATWHDAWRNLQRRVYVTAQREEYSTELSGTSTGDLLFAGAQLTKKNADDAVFPRRGYSWSVDARAGSDELGSTTSFSRVHGSGNFVRGFGQRVRFLLRGEYGAIRAGDFDELPPSQRFYAGGDGSVRGYGFQELGPEDENGAKVGGRYALVASAELEFLVVRNYGAALFFDAGNASNDPWPDLMKGVGIGARWRSPIGVVGIDIARPLDDPDTDYRLHLSVGSDL